MERPSFLRKEGYQHPSGGIVLTRSESSRLEGVLFDLYEGLLQISKEKLTAVSRGKGTVKYRWAPLINLVDGGEVFLDEIFPSESGNSLTTEPFFDFVLGELEEEERDKILSYMDKGGRVLIFRRIKSSKDFLQSLTSYSETYHGGFAPFTISVLAGLTLTHQDNNLSGEEVDRLTKLKNLSQRKTPIHFYPLSKIGDKKDQKELKAVFKRLNRLSDQWEFVYDLLLTASELAKKQTLFSEIFIGLGAISYWPLKAVSRYFGEQKSMIASQLTGEALIQLLNKADNLIHNPQIRFLLSSLGINLFSLSSERESSFVDREEVRRRLFNWVEKVVSVVSLLSTIPSAYYLSHRAFSSGDIRNFLLIAPVNSSLLILGELINRTLMARQTLGQYSDKDRETFMKVLEHQTLFLKGLIRRFPSLAVALIDFAENKPALYAYLGTLVSFPALTAANLSFNIPLEVNESLSAFIFEGMAGVIGGVISQRRDCYQAFIDLISQIREKRGRNFRPL